MMPYRPHENYLTTALMRYTWRRAAWEYEPDRSGTWNDLCDVARMTADPRPNITGIFVHATALHRFRWQRRQVLVTPVPNPQLMFYRYAFDNTVETGQ